MGGFKDFIRMINEAEGIAPEGIFLVSIVILFLFLVFAREYFKALTPPYLLAVNLNRTAWYFSVLATLTYWVMLYRSSPLFDAPWYGVHSDGAVYLYRMCFVTIFLIYLFYSYRNLMLTARCFYTFEYYFVLLFAMLGLNTMLIASNFINLLISMEMYSIATYYLLNDKKSTNRSPEAALKYFVISSIGTAVFLFGLFLVYYASGSMEPHVVEIVKITSYCQFAGYFFIALTFFIKLGAGIYFFWVLDAYEGTSFTMLIFLNIFVKPTFIVVLFKMLHFSSTLELFVVFRDFMFWTCIIGVLGACVQTKIKRFLIFSSVYNVGFLTCFFWDPTAPMLAGYSVFFFIYALNSLCLMMVFGMLRDETTKFLVSDIKDISSVLPQNKPLAIALIFLLFVMSGLPPFSFFYIKFFLYMEMFTHISTFYIAVLVIASAIATFFYIRLIRIVLFTRGRPTYFLFFDSYVVATILGFATAINIWFFLFVQELVIILGFFNSIWTF